MLLSVCATTYARYLTGYLSIKLPLSQYLTDAPFPSLFSVVLPSLFSCLWHAFLLLLINNVSQEEYSTTCNSVKIIIATTTAATTARRAYSVDWPQNFYEKPSQN